MNGAIPFESLDDRQKYLIEARLRANEDPILARMPVRSIARAARQSQHRADPMNPLDPRNWITPPERYEIMDFVKVKFDMAVGHVYEGGWDIDTMPIADFGNVNAAGALTVRAGFNTFPLINPAHVIGSIDPEPFELSTLTAINGDRQIGTSSQPIVLLLGCYIVHIAAGGTVYQPATTTFNARVFSASGATGGAYTTEATLAVNTATNFVDQVPIVATTGRGFSITGTALTNICACFNGDSWIGELVMGGAVNHQGSVLYGMLELA